MTSHISLRATWRDVKKFKLHSPITRLHPPAMANEKQRPGDIEKEANVTTFVYSLSARTVRARPRTGNNRKLQVLQMRCASLDRTFHPQWHLSDKRQSVIAGTVHQVIGKYSIAANLWSDFFRCIKPTM